jgi:beta-glucosidase
LENAGFKIVPALEKLYTHFIDTLTAVAKEENRKQVVDVHAELPIDKSFIETQATISDIAVMTIGRNAGEGADRSIADFSLTETEKTLIKTISEVYHAAGKRVVVVLNIGGIIATTDWRNEPDAILLAWQTGQEGGNAIADILKGKVNPSGKLPMSFPVKYEEVPSSKSFPGEPKENPVNAPYEEGIYVGYRYYDSFSVPVAYEFGYGLSYTQFEYSEITLDHPLFYDKVTATVTVKNRGNVAGKEAIQLYISAPQEEIEKPVHELKAFAKTRLLQPGESQNITFTLDARALASFWSGFSTWMTEKGTYEIGIGASSRDIRRKISFNVPQTIMVEKEHDVLYPNRALKEVTRDLLSSKR